MKNVVKVLAGVGLATVVGWGMVPAAMAQGRHAEDTKAVASDGDLQSRVKSALHSDPALLDKHIDVTVEKGNVVLRGFVESPQALQKAVKAATEAAGGRKVVNNLTIKEGGDGGSG